MYGPVVDGLLHARARFGTLHFRILLGPRVHVRDFVDRKVSLTLIGEGAFEIMQRYAVA